MHEKAEETISTLRNRERKNTQIDLLEMKTTMSEIKLHRMGLTAD